MSETEFRIGLDASAVTAGAKEIEKALTVIDKSAQGVGDRASKNIDKISQSLDRTLVVAERAQRGLVAIGNRGGGGRGGMLPGPSGAGGGGGFLMLPGPGFGGGGGARSPRTMLNGIPTGPKIVEGTVVGGAARAGGARAAGGLAGRVLGAAGGPLGMVAGSLIGGGIASMFRGGDSGLDPQAESENRIQQMMVRGMSGTQATRSDTLARDVETKFQISADRITSAIVDAQMGSAEAIKSILQDMGINSDQVRTANEALSIMQDQAGGAAQQAAEAQRGVVGKAWDNLANTGVGRAVGYGVDVAAGTIAGSVNAVTSEIPAGLLNTAANALGGPQGVAQDARVAAPELANDLDLNKRRRGGGDMRIVVSAAKNVPTTMKNMGGR